MYELNVCIEKNYLFVINTDTNQLFIKLIPDIKILSKTFPPYLFFSFSLL